MSVVALNLGNWSKKKKVNERVKCLAQEHNITPPAAFRARPWTAQSGD